MQDAASALLSKLQTSSKQFDPWIYLSTAHADTPGEQLQQGLRKLESSMSARKDQMRQLVKENFQRFIGCKGTIDDISHKLRVCCLLSPMSLLLQPHPPPAPRCL